MYYLVLMRKKEIVGAVIAIINFSSMDLIEVAAVLTGQMKTVVIVEEIDEQAVVLGALEYVVEEPGALRA